VRRAAYRIIEGKGATWFGIGAGIARMAKAIVHDENALMTCSTPTRGLLGTEQAICLSYPRVINRQGVVRTLVPEMNETELALLQKSAEILARAASDIGVLDV